MTQKPLKKTEFFNEMSDEGGELHQKTPHVDKDNNDNEVLSQPRSAVHDDFKPVRPSSSILSDLRSSHPSNSDNIATAGSARLAGKVKSGAFRLFEFSKRVSTSSAVQPSTADVSYSQSQSQDYSDIENEVGFRFHSEPLLLNDAAPTASPADDCAAELASPRPLPGSMSINNSGATSAASLKSKSCQPTGLRVRLRDS